MKLLVVAAGKYDHIDFKPSAAMVSAAKSGLERRKKHGRGGTPIGVARARDITNRKNMSPGTVRRMKAYFDRSQSQDRTDSSSAAAIAWALWGGDSGYSWSKGKYRQMEAADKKSTASVEELFSVIVKDSKEQMFSGSLKDCVMFIEDYDDQHLIYTDLRIVDQSSEEVDYQSMPLQTIASMFVAADKPCWKNYKQIGMKPGKKGKKVPNCVPK